MDIVSGTIDGLQAALSPDNLLYCLIGVLVGTMIGVLPGLGASSGIALLLPLTFGLPPASGLILLAGIYYGANYGGTITSVLLGIPGEGSTAISVIEGNAMAKQGRGGQALALAAIASFLAGTLTIVALSVSVTLFSEVALLFGPPEYFALLLLALLSIGALGSADPLKGVAMSLLGLLVATVGISSQWVSARFTFGQTELLSGFGFVSAVIGLFALTDVFRTINHGHPEPIRTHLRDMMLSKDDLKRSILPSLRGSAIGFGIGVLPGIGSTTASVIAYDVERRVGKRKGRPFGTGALEGLVAPEAANNASDNGTFLPTLTLGVPGSGGTALLLGAFIMYGIQPGPLLMTQQSTLVWTLIASFYVGNVMLLLINLPLAPLFAAILRIRYANLYPFILSFCFVGAFAVENRMWGIWVACAFGVVGYVLAENGYPALPIVIGLILGPIMEENLVRTKAMGGGSFDVFLERPVALVIFGLFGVIVATVAATKLKRRLTTRTGLAEGQRLAP